MKKLLLSLAAVAIAGSAFAAEEHQLFELKFGNNNNDKNQYYEPTSNYYSSFTYKLQASSESFTVSNFNANYSNGGWSDMIKCGRKDNASIGMITSDFKITQQLTSVVLGINKLNESGIVNSFKVQTSTDKENGLTLSLCLNRPTTAKQRLLLCRLMRLSWFLTFMFELQSTAHRPKKMA